MELLENPGEKPRSEKYRPELTRLPPLTLRRRFLRWIARWVCRAAVFFLLRLEIHGLDNFPQKGPALIVANHLGDTDGILGMAFFPVHSEGLGKIELYDYPVVGRLMEAYGIIWVHRGQPDRRAIRAALKALEEERMVAIAPEARESLTGSLEKGTGGAAYLAFKSGVPLVPVTFTGTENANVLGSLKRLRRPKVTLTVGQVFRLEFPADRHRTIEDGTEQIMKKLAAQLPPQYRGVYREVVE